MYKLLIAGALLVLLAFGINAAQDPAAVYGPTLKEYAEVTCKLQKTGMGYKYTSLQTKQQKLWNRLYMQTAKLTPEQRMRYTKAYSEAMSCTQPKNKPLTSEQLTKIGCKGSNVSNEQAIAAAAGDSKMLQALGKTQMVKNMYDKEVEKQMQARKEQLELHGGGIDPCKEYDPLDHIPD